MYFWCGLLILNFWFLYLQRDSDIQIFVFKRVHSFKAIYFLKNMTQQEYLFDRYTHDVILTNCHATYILSNEEIDYTWPPLFNMYTENLQCSQYFKKFPLFGSIFYNLFMYFSWMIGWIQKSSQWQPEVLNISALLRCLQK